MPETWTIGNPDYDAVILQTQEAYVGAFPRGVLEEVESDHWMENDVPDRVVQELEEVIRRIPG